MTRSIVVLTVTEPNSIGGKKFTHGASERLHNALVGATKQTKSKMGAPTRNAMYPKNPRTATAEVPSETMIKTRTVFTNGRPLATHRNVQSVDEFSSCAIALLQLHRNIILPLPAPTVIPVACGSSRFVLRDVHHTAGGTSLKNTRAAERCPGGTSTGTK